MGVTYNSILDDNDEEDEIAVGCSRDSSALTAGSAFETLPVGRDDTQLSSFLCENDSSISSDLNQHRKRRRIVKKRKIVDNCLGVDALPELFRGAFAFQYFNRMQTEAFPSLYESDENCIVSSPTGSGKTTLFELAIMRLIGKFNQTTKDIKILYIAPTKSLCYERFKNWSPKFLNLTVGMLTSDTPFLESENVRKSNIIITTPEKWDMLTRKWKEYSPLLELIKLVLVDEIHILRERRGATLEVVLTRMNLFCDNIRVIAVSATIPNVEDVSRWLKTKATSEPAKVLAFDDSYRQVSLEKWVYGASFSNSNEFKHDSLYNLKLPDIFRRHCKQRPVLIFCPTRASTVSTAKYIAQNCQSFWCDRTMKQTCRPNDQTLADCFYKGVAFHHAGLSAGDRENVEKAFIGGDIKVVCCTSTLAVGVNLPAYLVIIKGTRIWNASAAQEYAQADILQMIGRAGRPQFEKDGCAVILTSAIMKRAYENLLHGVDKLESSLHLELIEHLAAEISLRTVFSAQSAVRWLRNTFFYVRFSLNPSAYTEVSSLKVDKLEDSQIYHFCGNLLGTLLTHGVIEGQDGSFHSTAFGLAMTRHYILFDTMKVFMATSCEESPKSILEVLSNAKEFADLRLRQKEKRLYEEINKSPLIKYPFQAAVRRGGVINSPSQKVSLIIQFELGGLDFPSYKGAAALHQSLILDKALVFKDCFRLLKCMIDIFIEKKNGNSLKNALFLLRCITGNCWEDSAMVLRQLKSIGLMSVRKLVQSGVHSLQEMSELSNQQIDNYLGLKKAKSFELRKNLEIIPKLSLSCKIEDLRADQSIVFATFEVKIGSSHQSDIWHGQTLSVDVEVLKTTGELLDYRKLPLRHLNSTRTFKVTSIFDSAHDEIEFIINCAEIAGLGVKKTVYARQLLPSHFYAILANSNKNIHSQDNLEALSNSQSSDDSIIRYFAESTANGATKCDTDDCRKVRSNGNLECFHTCKDKKNCRHLCCKEGIPRKSLQRKRLLDTTNQGVHHEFKDHDPQLERPSDPNDSRDPVDSAIARQAQNELDSWLGRHERESSSSISIMEIAPIEGSEHSIRDWRDDPLPAFRQGILSESELEFLGSDVELC